MALNLSSVAYDALKKKIITEYSGGNFISLRKIAKEVNIGYTPAREAFQRLTNEGLLKLIPNVGYIIPEMTSSNINEVFLLRECIELFVFEKVFDEIDEDITNQLEAIIEKQVVCLDNTDISGFYKSDEEFHLLFFSIFNKSRFTELIRSIREQYLLCTVKTIYQMQSSGTKDAIDDHKAILTCIGNKDKEAARAAFQDHIRKAKMRALEMQY